MDPRFSILTFPQAFDGDKLHLNILVVPRLSAPPSGQIAYLEITGAARA